MSVVNVEPFDELIDRLRAQGYSIDAESISSLRTAMWTTSSEMVGELGLAIMKFQSQNPAAPDELKLNLARCMKEVRKVWPGIRSPFS